MLSLSWMRPGATVSLIGLCSLSGLLSACGSPLKAFPSQEEFASTATYSRLFDASAAQTCEAARRALLSQGYITPRPGKTWSTVRKAFNPSPSRTCRLRSASSARQTA